MEKTANKWRRRAFKTATLVGLCALIGVVLYICGIIWQAVAVVIVTAIIVFLLHGFVNRLQAHKIPRWAGTTIAFLIILLFIVGCILLVVPALITQLTSFARELPGYVTEIQAWVSDMGSKNSFIDSSTINAAITTVSNYLREEAGTIASSLASGVMGGLVSFGNIMLVTFISLICSFWLLLDLPTIAQEIKQVIPDKHHQDVQIFRHAFGTAVYGWAKSTLICAIVTGVVSWIAFIILGIPYSAVLGLLCGVLYVIPYIGPMIASILVAIIALFVSPLVCIISIAVNVVISNLVGSILSPRLMKSSVNVYPAFILIAILIGSALGGIAGMLLSIPIVGALQGLFVAYYEARTGKQISSYDGVLFQKPKKKLPWHVRREQKKAAAKEKREKEAE